MILRIIIDESTGATKSFGLFGKSLSELKTIFSSIRANGIIGTFLTSPTIDKKAIIDYNTAIKEATDNGATMAEKQQIMKSAMEGTNKATAQLIGTTNGATVSTEALTAAQKASTLAAKAGAVALKALSIAGNMLAALAITKFVSFVATIIDNLAHSAEHCKERVDELMFSYQSAIDKANSNAKTVEELASRYEELSKGVNNLGERVSLTTDEYTEYNKIVNQIADMFPTLIQGWTDEGNAILSIKGNVEQLRDAYKEAQQEAYNLLIVDGKDSDGNDIVANYKNVLSNNSPVFKFDSTAGEYLEIVKTLYDAMLASEEEYDKMYTAMLGGGNKLTNDYNMSPAQRNKVKKTLKKIGFKADLTDEDKRNISANAKAYMQTYQAEIISALKDVQILANAYLMTNEDYANLDDQAKNAVSIIVNTINENVASGFKDKMDVGAYVSGIINSIKDNPKIQDALVGLFTLDISNMQPNDAKALIDQYIDYIARVLEENPVELKARLGFEYVDTISQNYNQVMWQAATKFSGELYIPYGDNLLYRAELEALNKFAEENSINTQDEIAFWNKCIEESETREEAMEKYLESSFANENPIFFSDIFSLKDADNNLTELGKISESIDTIQNAYKTLNDAIDEYNEEGAFSIDTLQSVIALGDDWLDYLVDEEGHLKLDKEALEELAQARLNDMRIQAINNVIDNVSKIQDEAGANEYLTSTNYALADSYEAMAKAVAKARLSDARANMAKAVEAGDLSQESMDAALNKATADIDKINKMFANTSIGAGSITGNFGKGKSSSKSEFSETVDFFERRVEVLDNALSHLKSTMNNISGSSAKNNLVDAELGITGEKFKNYTDALSMYTQKANEALSKLPADIAAKVKDGAVSLTDFVGDGNKDVVEAIKDYESWADKVADCKQELTELKKDIRQLELEKFNNIMEDFQDQFDLRGDSKDLISKQIDLLKEAGELVGESFFTAQIDQSKKQLELLEAEKAQLVNQMSSAINSGRIQKGTEEWMSMVSSLNSVDSSILDCKKSIEEFDNSILELHTEIFNHIQDQFSNLDSEISNILDLFEEFEVSDDIGIWSKEALAQLGLLSQQYELAQYQIQQYNDEIDKLNAQYLSGKYSATEYADKLADLTDKQWNAVKASESAKNALMDLNETRIENQISGIENEIDAYKELTDAQIEALKASKDLHDYEKSIVEKTKSITDLERQIAAMHNDNSAATIAKRKKLEEQLAEAKNDLDEAEYEHSIEAQEDALNKQYEAYEKERNDEIDALRESLNDKEAILSSSFETVKNNASTVGQEIATIATQHGITISKSLISSWQSGEKAIASYGAVLSQNTSAFIGNIMDVENEVWNLQAQANTTADSLAWMFSTKADNLVNELTTSYYAEYNLAYMTQALQNSLINTLERGYNVNNIVSSLNSIENAANSAKTAIDRLNSYRSDFIENIAKNAETLIGGLVNNDYLTYEEVQELLKTKNAASHTTLEKYASGTRSSKGEIFISDEDGYEMKLPKLANGQYTIANEGTQILTKAQTDNIFEWAKFNPEDFVPINMTDYMDNLRAGTMPTILPNNVVNNSSVNVHYDSLINVQGSLNSTDVKQMEAIASKAVDRMVDKINDGITYGK